MEASSGHVRPNSEVSWARPGVANTILSCCSPRPGVLQEAGAAAQPSSCSCRPEVACSSTRCTAVQSKGGAGTRKRAADAAAAARGRPAGELCIVQWNGTGDCRPKRRTHDDNSRYGYMYPLILLYVCILCTQNSHFYKIFTCG